MFLNISRFRMKQNCFAKMCPDYPYTISRRITFVILLELRISKLLLIYIKPLNFLSKHSKSITHLTLNLSFERRIKKFTTKQTIKTIFLYLIYGFSNYVRFFPDTPLTYDTKRKLNRNKNRDFLRSLKPNTITHAFSIVVMV